MDTLTRTDAPAQDGSPSRVLPALAGALAAGLALAVSELVAGLFFSAPSLILAIGDQVIDLAPTAIERWAIDTLGTADKPALVIGIVVLSLLFGAGLGLLHRTRPGLAILGFVAFGVLGYLAGTQSLLASDGLTFFTAGAATVAGLAALASLSRVLNPSLPTEPDRSRRAFVAGAAAVGVTAIAAAGLGRWLTNRTRIAVASRDEVVLPRPSEPVLDPLPAQIADIDGITPLVTPNTDFYRIDTALSVPTVDLDTWELSFEGMVDRPFTLSYDEILSLPMVERHITIACVSNRVGGNLIGNAKWLGVPLSVLLSEAGVQAGGDQLVARSVDDFTVGFPTEAAFDGREALLAVGMNGEPLPFEHGFPARLVVSGLYGYVSATKWLSSIELTGWDDFDAYWIPRGWSKEAPIKTHSRIDTPRNGSREGVGPTTVAGVAWAQNRGVERVEVRVNEGPWIEAQLPEELTIDTWRQWSATVDLVAGDNVIQVRATDTTGVPQTDEIRQPAPNGATGYHTITVTA